MAPAGSALLGYRQMYLSAIIPRRWLLKKKHWLFARSILFAPEFAQVNRALAVFKK